MPDAFLEMRHIVKSYPGVRAVDDVSLQMARGEVRALVGENGAGKSTLIKILAGAVQPDSGEIWLGGERVRYDGPVQALALGIGAIYQEFNLVPQLNIAQNIMLGQVPKKWGGRVDTKAMHRQAREMLARLNVNLDTRRLVSELDVAQQQVVEIAKGLARDLRVFIMDEPTAALSAVETEHLFEVVQALKKQGVAIIYITHRMREIFQIADSVTILKDGKHVETSPASSLTSDAIVAKMIGRDLTDYYPPRSKGAGDVLLSVRNLNAGNQLVDVSLDIRRGEILGVAGLEGQGQRELARVLFGALPYDSCTFSRNGQPLRLTSPADAIKAGIAYVSDDRKRDGLVLIRSVNENVALPSLSRRKVGGVLVDDGAEKSFVTDLIQKLAIKVTSRAQNANNLSGGNQQKIVVAKWLGMEPQILIVAEPTRGIDVGSKSEIHHILRELADQGVGIVMVSSELPEVLGMSDRILVMSEGRIVSELPGATATEEQLLAAAATHSLANSSAPLHASA
jgi:ABC-type sugar transport system ATPase subunit